VSCKKVESTNGCCGADNGAYGTVLPPDVSVVSIGDAFFSLKRNHGKMVWAKPECTTEKTDDYCGCPLATTTIFGGEIFVAVEGV
jgi:hypothetical protein